MKKTILMALLPFLLSCLGCTRPAPEQLTVYPREQSDDSERKAGRAMLFYEEAEKDADIHNVTVTPPIKPQGQ